MKKKTWFRILKEWLVFIYLTFVGLMTVMLLILETIQTIPLIDNPTSRTILAFFALLLLPMIVIIPLAICNWVEKEEWI